MKDLLKKMFSGKGSSEPNFLLDEHKNLLDVLLKKAYMGHDGYHSQVKFSTYSEFDQLKTLSPEVKHAVFFQLVHYFTEEFKGAEPWHVDWNRKLILSGLMGIILRMKDVVFSEGDLLAVSIGFKQVSEGLHSLPYNQLVNRIEEMANEKGLTETLKKCLSTLYFPITGWTSAEEKKINNRLEKINHGPTEFGIDDRDDVGKAVSSFIGTVSAEERKAWITLLNMLGSEGHKSAPSKAWLKQFSDASKQIYTNALVLGFVDWMGVAIDVIKEIHKNANPMHVVFLIDENHAMLRGMVWGASVLNDDRLNQRVEELGLACFKKLSGYGAVSVKVGNGCVWAFSKLPFEDGVSRLTKFRMKIKYPSVQKQIEKAITQIAKKEGKTNSEIEELAVQDFGLNQELQIESAFGDYTGIASIERGNTVVLTWQSQAGKVSKSVPKQVREEYGEELKELKRTLKDLGSTLLAQKLRIENMYLEKREWLFEHWNKLYVEHNLLSYFSRRLIWSFEDEDGTEHNALYWNGGLVNPNGEQITEPTSSWKVHLWHPIESDANEVVAWRSFLLENEIQQPFKQAHREIYLVTDAEIATNTYSNRFASHILRQHIFNALCRERGWRYTVIGQWDSHNTPTKSIPEWGIRAEFWVDANWNEGTATPTGVFHHIFTDQVRVYDKERQLPMAEVPPLVFSEVMRDVDLFVGVTSIGADPNWQDGGEARFTDYWRTFSFGELSVGGAQRKELLKALVPKLKIKDQCSFEDNFLVVEGKKRIYKIHMGSGNILMKPNDQYLCIVPDRSTGSSTVFLPFEGDVTLSLILSKAVLLAADDKITDRTILSQINF